MFFCMMSNYKLLGDASYVKISSYRVRVVDCLSESDVLIPTQISEKSGIRTNHISKVLRELKDRRIIECLNEDARKGRRDADTGLIGGCYAG